MATKAKFSKKTSSNAGVNTDEIKASEMTTTVRSWGIDGSDGFYQFPPGLFGVKAITFWRDNRNEGSCIILKNDGTITAWNIDPPGGRINFHKHLETLTHATRIKASLIADDPWRQSGVYVWKTNGSCEFHCIDYSNDQQIQVVDLGKNILDILPGHKIFALDVAVLADGSLKEISVLKKNAREINEEFKTLQENLKKLNKGITIKQRDYLADYKSGYMHELYRLGYALLWADHKGALHHQYYGDNSGIHDPDKIRGVEFVAGANKDAGELVVLQDGQLKKLDLYRSGALEPLPDYGGYSSLNEPIVALKDAYYFQGSHGGGLNAAIGITASGRAFLVTTSDISRPAALKRLYAKKNISPLGRVITDAIFYEETFIGIERVSAEHMKDYQTSIQGPAKVNAGQLFVAGQDDLLAQVQIRCNPGPVIDAQIWKCEDIRGLIGWVCAKQDGSIFGLEPSNEGLDMAPPWFPRDISAISVDNGFVATRTNGRTLKWGPTHLKGGNPTTPEVLEKYPNLKLPDESKDAIKVIHYEQRLALAILKEVSAFRQFLGKYFGPGSMPKDKLFYSITRGQALLDQAVGWWGAGPWNSSELPIAGKQGPTATIRGLQWRLCMAWAGFETWLTGLLATENAKLEAVALARWSRGINKLVSIEAPKAGKGISKWIDEEGGDAVLDFLGMNRTDRETMRTWMLNGKDVNDWPNLVLLARALRNAIAHGALSASAAQELGLQPALEKLPSLLQDFAHGALRLYMQK